MIQYLLIIHHSFIIYFKNSQLSLCIMYGRCKKLEL